MNATRTLRLIQSSLACLALVALVTGCQKLAGFEDFSAAGSSTGGTAGTDGGDGSSGSCPTNAPEGLKGSEMTAVASLSGTCFFIDRYEVSAEEFEVFRSLPFAQMDAPCAAVTSHGSGCTAVDGGVVPVVANLPATCISWCSAQAYCKWAGKTLCRGDYANFDNAELSDWMSICSNNGTTNYPFGNNAKDDVCNGENYPHTDCPTCTVLPVKSQAACKTSTGVLNLSGNAAEWVNECNDNTGLTDRCSVRGGSYSSDSEQLQCNKRVTYDRGARDVHVGFRCCAYQ